MSAIKTAGAGLSAVAGLGSSFALAACCALPMGFAALGIGSSGLTPLVSATQPYTFLLRIVAAVSIAAAVLLVTFAARTCSPAALCARRGFRFSIYGIALVSLGLLAASFIYG